MSDTMLRHLVATVIVLLLIFQIGSFIASAYGVLWGTAAAVTVVVVLYLSARTARSAANNSYWFLLSLLLFAIFVIGYILWQAMTENVGWLERMINLAPFIVGFVAPVVLLLMVYIELRNRVKSGE